MKKPSALLRLTRFGEIFLAAILLPTAASAPAQVLFEDSFDTDTSAQWSVFDGALNFTPDFTARWAFDYSAQRYVANGVTNVIPPAPGGTGTRGVKLTVNKDDVPAAAAVSLFPKNQSFTGAYSVKFDMWLNYNGGAYGGSGSTEHAAFGLNHAGDKVVWADANFLADGVFFSVAGEAGAGATVGDYNAYAADGTIPAEKRSGADGGFLDRDGDGATEEEVNPNQPATYPLKQIFPAPAFESSGAPGKHWVQVELRQVELGGTNRVIWLMNGFVIADNDLGVLYQQQSGTVMLGLMDLFQSIANPKEDNYVIYDNLRVTSLAGAPEQPVVSVAADDPDAAEPTDPGSFTVTRTGDLLQPLTVGLRIGGSATFGADYDFAAGQPGMPTHVVFPAGQATVGLPVLPLDDPSGELDEAIVVTLLGGSTYDLRTGISATVTLRDDGDIPLVGVRTVRAVAYERNPARTATVALYLTTPAAANLAVPLAYGGTATNGAAYEPLPASVEIPAGETNVFLTLIPRDNDVLDGDRTVTVTPSAGAGFGVVSNAIATVTVRDDDLAPGTPAFADAFDADSAAAWNVNLGPGDGVAEFAFDYSTVGVPPAPKGTTTKGLKLQANQASAVFGGLSVSPQGQNFPGDFRLRFDLWQQFNGRLPGGGPGSTQITGAGVGTAGTTPQWPGGTHDGVWFAATADGGSGVDYRAYSPAAPAGYVDASGVFSAGTTTGVRNEAHPYYAGFGGVSAPDAQLALFPDQAGVSFTGAQGFQWHDVAIEKRGDSVTWTIDGLRIATVVTTNIAFGGGSILLNYSDINGGSSSDPNAAAMLFGLFDNVRVELLSPPSGPVEITGAGFVNQRLRLTFTGAATDTPASFQIVVASAVSGPYTPDASATSIIIQTAPGEFRTEVSPNGDAKFIQVLR
ncbi:MAG: hypothetical protein ACKVYV_14355 [Limisphaerales bacterium]